jgi:hypothetical protein
MSRGCLPLSIMKVTVSAAGVVLLLSAGCSGSAGRHSRSASPQGRGSCVFARRARSSSEVMTIGAQGTQGRSLAQHLSVFRGPGAARRPPSSVIRQVGTAIRTDNEVARAAHLARVGSPIFAKVEMLVRSRQISMYGVPTTTGSVCVTYTPIELSAECLDSLENKSTWTVASFNCGSRALVIGGLVDNDVTRPVMIQISHQLVRARTADNAFLYVSPPGEPHGLVDAKALRLRLRNGSLITVPLQMG